MLDLIKLELQQILNNIDSGNSNINESQQNELLNILYEINTKELNKIQSADYIGKSRATFDNYIKKGLIPEGKSKRGSHQLYWNKSDLDKYVKSVQQ